MLRKRLILCLLMKGDLFMNSRQFKLNPVGNLETILQYLHFDAIDELVILNVSRGEKDLPAFAENLEKLAKYCFIPIAAGGGVRTLDDCKILLNAGADKIVINSSLHNDPGFVSQAIKKYGTQCIVASVDVKKERNGQNSVYINNGADSLGVEPLVYCKNIEKLGVGEIFVTSIDKDGTCQGYDIELVKQIAEAVNVPVIASGGVGDFKHLVEGINLGGASAVSAANIFHFVGQSLWKAKEYVREMGIGFPQPLWNFQKDHKL